MDLKYTIHFDILDLEKDIHLTNYFQSYEYFKVQKTIGNTPMYVIVRDKNRINMINMFIHYPKDKIIRSLGEPLFLKSHIEESLKCALDFVDAYSKKNNIRLSIIDCIDFGLTQVYQEKKYTIERYSTSILDLQQTEEQLLMLFKKELRRILKKDYGIQVIEITNPDELEEVYGKCYKLSDKLIPDRFFEEARRKMKFNSHHYYYAIDATGELLGTLAMVIYNGEARELHSSLTKYSYDNRLPAQDFLHWHIIKEAKKKGCTTFNTAGFQILPKSQKEAGIRQYKLKYNGEIYPMLEMRKYYGVWRYIYGVRRILQK